ncbi:MAG: Ni/Fe-hydrogenase cytochrome b subunit [Elusimicrobia bacterium]|nr:Ni/Fe-hydrogenase cytochrome b subunit [Elusimicrobiota bacterium]
MDRFMRPTPLPRRFLTPGVGVLILLALNGLVFLAGRLLFGIGAVTNLSNQYPWGIWIGIDVAAGVALAAGGFTTAALGHVMHREQYHAVVRPALLTALLGYTFVALGVCIDIGRPYYIWHPLVMWNGTSALFEVGICVVIYIHVLYIEFLPVAVERFLGRVALPGPLARLNPLAERLLAALDRGLARTMFVFIIAGVVLSTLHQSSLGTLMVIAGPKMHPLWQTPILPLLFLLSAVSVGFPMVILESLLAARSFGLKPEMSVLAGLGRMTAPLLGVYLAFKIGDMFVRETFVHLATFNTASVMFMVEVLFGVVIPLRMFMSRAVLKSPALLLTASALVVAGVAVNRVDNFLIAYTPPYSLRPYHPAFGEVCVTVGFISLLVLLYRAAVLLFPVISLPDRTLSPKAKYTVHG